MILGLDHIAFSSTCLQTDIRRFQTLGYVVRFREHRLRDLENKRFFMREFTGELDMALLRRGGSIAIELLNHGHTIDAPSYVLPVFEAPAATRGQFDTFSFRGHRFRRVSNVSGTFFVDINGGNDFHCEKVVVEAEDIPTAVTFWTGLGFKRVVVEDAAACLELQSLLDRRLVQMLVRKTAGTAPRCWLDARGFNCLAFFSSNAEKDRKRFADLGMNPTEPNDIHVNGKDLSIYWVRGAAGEVAEIIGLAQRQSTTVFS